MRYFIIDTNTVDLKAFQDDLEIILIEVDNDGRVEKEIGLNTNQKIVHAFPSGKFKNGIYGIFDLNVFELMNQDDDIQGQQFYSYWDKLST